MSGELGAEFAGAAGGGLPCHGTDVLATKCASGRFPIFLEMCQPYLTSRDLAYALLIIIVRKKRDNHRGEPISPETLPSQPLTITQ